MSPEEAQILVAKKVANLMKKGRKKQTFLRVEEQDEDECMLGVNAAQFENDSHSGTLSYSKMIYERNQRHPRKKNSSEQYPVGVTVGVLGEWQNNEFEEEFGPGVSIYFKMLNMLSILFLGFTVLSLPMFWLCLENQENTENHMPHVSPFKTFGILGKLSVGIANLGANTPPKCYFAEKIIECDYGTL